VNEGCDVGRIRGRRDCERVIYRGRKRSSNILHCQGRPSIESAKELGGQGRGDVPAKSHRN
jgi:hypothetical protein